MTDPLNAHADPLSPDMTDHRPYTWTELDAPSARIPNLLHVLLLLLLTVLIFMAVGGLLAAVAPGSLRDTVAGERTQLLAQALIYVLVLALSWFLFPLLWRCRFLTGISWNAGAASPWLIGAGLGLGVISQLTESLLPLPKHTPIEKLAASDQLIWPLVALGTLFAPLFEEILFRGFLLPAFANAIDWLRAPRSTEAYALWRSTSTNSRPAIIVSVLITSALFGVLHAQQIGWSIPAVCVLALISIALCLVRLRTHSVAASTLVHASYNACLFLTLFLATGGFKHLDQLR